MMKTTTATTSSIPLFVWISALCLLCIVLDTTTPPTTTTIFLVEGLTINQRSAKEKRPVSWLIDGNNMLGQRGVKLPRDLDKLAEKLVPMSGTTGGSSTPNQVVLVFDGRKDIDLERTETQLNDNFKQINCRYGTIADDFLLEEIRSIRATDPTRRVKLVTADKYLRRSALAIRPTVKQVVNPTVFWKKYVPRLTGQKKNQTPHQPRNGDTKSVSRNVKKSISSEGENESDDEK